MALIKITITEEIKENDECVRPALKPLSLAIVLQLTLTMVDIAFVVIVFILIIDRYKMQI